MRHAASRLDTWMRCVSVRPSSAAWRLQHRVHRAARATPMLGASRVSANRMRLRLRQRVDGGHGDAQVVDAVGHGLQAGEVDRVPQHADVGRTFAHAAHDVGADALVQADAHRRVARQERRDVVGQLLGEHRRAGQHPHAALRAVANSLSSARSRSSAEQLARARAAAPRPPAWARRRGGGAPAAARRPLPRAPRCACSTPRRPATRARRHARCCLPRRRRRRAAARRGRGCVASWRWALEAADCGVPDWNAKGSEIPLASPIGMPTVTP